MEIRVAGTVQRSAVGVCGQVGGLPRSAFAVAERRTCGSRVHHHRDRRHDGRLFGIVRTLYPVVAAGVALILAAFFWFVRSGQGSPAPAKEDDDSLTGA